MGRGPHERLSWRCKSPPAGERTGPQQAWRAGRGRAGCPCQRCGARGPNCSARRLPPKLPPKRPAGISSGKTPLRTQGRVEHGIALFTWSRSATHFMVRSGGSTLVLFRGGQAGGAGVGLGVAATGDAGGTAAGAGVGAGGRVASGGGGCGLASGATVGAASGGGCCGLASGATVGAAAGRGAAAESVLADKSAQRGGSAHATGLAQRGESAVGLTLRRRLLQQPAPRACTPKKSGKSMFALVCTEGSVLGQRRSATGSLAARRNSPTSRGCWCRLRAMRCPPHLGALQPRTIRAPGPPATPPAGPWLCGSASSGGGDSSRGHRLHPIQAAPEQLFQASLTAPSPL